jgi:hypothetical protein
LSVPGSTVPAPWPRIQRIREAQIERSGLGDPAFQRTVKALKAQIEGSSLGDPAFQRTVKALKAAIEGSGFGDPAFQRMLKVQSETIRRALFGIPAKPGVTSAAEPATKGAGSAARRGPKFRLISDSEKMNAIAIAEAEQHFRAGKTVGEVMIELGFSDDGDPNQKYRKKLRRLRDSLESPPF